MRLGVGSWHPTTRSAPHGAVNFAIALRVGQTMARERDRLRWLVGERRNKRPRITWLFCGPNGSCDNSRQGADGSQCNGLAARVFISAGNTAAHTPD